MLSIILSSISDFQMKIFNLFLTGFSISKFASEVIYLKQLNNQRQ